MRNITKFWYLEDFDLFKKIGRWNLMKICELMEMKSIKKGENILFDFEDKRVVYFLKSGTVKIVSTINDHTIFLVKKGNIFGELSLYHDDVNQEKAVVVEDVVVCFIDTDLMKQLIVQYNSLNNELLKLSGLKIRKLQSRLEDLLYKDSSTRIKDYIYDYVKTFGAKEGDVMVAKNLLSHSDIGHLTNTSRQTVNNVMSKLRTEGKIDYNKKIIQLIEQIK